MLLLTILFILFLSFLSLADEITERDGHGKPFGFGRPFQYVEEIDFFPNPKKFYENYILPYKPVKMKNVAKVSPAFTKWTDDYFISLREPHDHMVSVETVKKENRSQNVNSMPFVEFVKQYNTSGIYMVNPVPPFIGHDLVLPCPLQCKEIAEKVLVENIMWFSSGGTKSVVHTDSVDNLNCLYRGEKSFVMVDPTKYGDKVDLDRPEGSYSDIDVDSVDYRKYPGLADVEYYHVNVTAGDCLYIPYKWIHQVRSYNSNLAVNVWWDHYKNKDVDWDNCNVECDPNLTFMQIKFNGFDSQLDNFEQIRDHLIGVLNIPKKIEVEKFTNTMLGRDMEFLKQENRYDEAVNVAAELFSVLDLDKDSVLTIDEIKMAPDETWVEAREIMLEISSIVDGEIPTDEEEVHDEL